MFSWSMKKEAETKAEVAPVVSLDPKMQAAFVPEARQSHVPEARQQNVQELRKPDDAVAGMTSALAAAIHSPSAITPDRLKPAIAANSTAAAMQSITPGKLANLPKTAGSGASGTDSPITASASGGSQNGGANGAPGSNGGAGPGGSGPFSHKAPEGHAKKVSEVLGEVVWLMSQSPLHKQFFVSDLEWFVMTPILLQQFRIFYAKDRPMGVVLWARVNDEVAGRLQAGTTKLRPQDWKSGDQLWAVEVMAPFGGAEEMIKDLKANVFPAETLRFVAVTKDGRKEVKAV